MLLGILLKNGLNCTDRHVEVFHRLVLKSSWLGIQRTTEKFNQFLTSRTFDERVLLGLSEAGGVRTSSIRNWREMRFEILRLDSVIE